MKLSMSLTASMHWALAPPAVSPMMPILLFCLSHSVASARRSLPMVLYTHSVALPDASLSRYWCISYTILSDGSVNLATARHTHTHKESVSYPFRKGARAPNDQQTATRCASREGRKRK